jgi:hypothetical protein
MFCFRSRKIATLTLLVLLFNIFLTALFREAHELEEAGLLVPHRMEIKFLNLTTSGHCPACPTDNHPNTDHDHVSCDHHNYTSLTDRISYLEPATISTSLTFFEPFKAIPEVYLDKFIPPQNLA